MSRMSKAQEAFPELKKEVFDALAELPGNGAYLMWGAQAVDDGYNVESVVGVLKQFHMSKRRLPKEERDISRYDDLDDVGEALKKLTLSKRATKKIDPGYSKLLEYPNLTFYHVHAAHGMLHLGRDTEWCITNPAQWEHYKKHSEFVVVINSNFTRRGTFSKVIIQIGNQTARKSEFLTAKELKEFSTRSFASQPSKGCAYVFFDATDNAYEFRNGCDEDYNTAPQRSMEELLDYMAGEKGAVKKAVSLVVGTSNFDEADTRMDRVHHIQHVLRGAQKGKRIVPLVEDIRELQLFNPLSLLVHPKMRAVRDCTAVWEACTEDEKEVSYHEYAKILECPAANVRGLLEFAFESMWDHDEIYPSYCSYGADVLFTAARQNDSLNRDSKLALSRMFLKHILPLEPKELKKLFESMETED